MERVGRTRPWPETATRRDAFLRGVREAPSTPTFVVAASFVGFGALAHDVGLSLPQSVFAGGAIFALPGQVILLDQLAKGATLAALFFAVTLTAVRLLPLTVSLMPILRGRRGLRPVDFLHAHFVAITVWIESLRRLPAIPGHLRGAYYAGFALTVWGTCLVTTAIGYLLAVNLSPTVAAGLVFLTPIYFFLSLLAAADTFADTAALCIGAVLGPILYRFWPGFDLLITGLVGGSAAYALYRLREARRG